LFLCHARQATVPYTKSWPLRGSNQCRKSPCSAYQSRRQDANNKRPTAACCHRGESRSARRDLGRASLAWLVCGGGWFGDTRTLPPWG
jgi:hypothetical protein